jgi:hypothetical protein
MQSYFANVGRFIEYLADDYTLFTMAFGASISIPILVLLTLWSVVN